MNTISKADDAIANDVIYHNLCWAKAKKKALPKSKPVESYSKTLADIELLNFIENRVFQNPDTVLDMNNVNSTYRAILIENGANPEDLSVNYKKQLKELIQENINDIVFIKTTRRNEPEQLVASETQKQALREHTDAIANEEGIRLLWKLAKKIRGEVLQKSGNSKAASLYMTCQLY